jgi:hypothetical protein
VSEPHGLGPAGARNAGARRAVADVLVFVDADTEVHADAFTRVRAVFADEGLAAVFGSYDDRPPAPGVVSGFRNLLHHHVHQQGAGPATTFWAGLGAVRRAVFDDVGGFDDTAYARPSVEDIELGGRMAHAGLEIRLDPDLQATHLKAWSLRAMVVTDLRDRAIPWLLLVAQGRADPGALNLGLRHRASAAAVLAATGAVAARRPALALAAAAGFVGLNRDFYALLARRRGPGAAVAGVGLHVVHHLTGIAALPAAALVAGGSARTP